jgi:hypothetical protein
MLPRAERYRLCAARGMSVAETARLYDVTTTAIRQMNKRHGLGFDVRPCKRDRDLAAMRERVETLASQGKCRREMSAMLDVPFNTIERWCRQWKVRFADKAGYRKPVMDMVRDRLSPAEIDDLLLLKRKGYTYRDAFQALRRPDLLEFLP